jgi:serine/threonine-protein kinase
MAEYYMYFVGAALVLGLIGFLAGSGKISLGPLTFFAALAIILLPVAFNSFIWLYGASPQEAVVPNVLGLSSSDAFEAIKGAGLVPEISGISFSQKSSGIVLSQRPEAGRKVKAKRTIELILSAMEKGTPVPGLVGRSREEAESLLGEKGFIIEETFIISEEAGADTVIEQSPAAGNPLASGASVSITISTKGEKND